MKKEHNPKVSIIIPLYNQERYFRACIVSVLNQTYRDIEIIVVDDGSTDNSPMIADGFASKDNRVRVIHKKNEGTSFARRDGYLAANGTYLAFMDNDDLMPKDAIEILVNEIEKKNVDLVFGSIERKLNFFTKKPGSSNNTFPCGEVIRQPQLYDDYYIGFFGISCLSVSIWGKLYRKAIIDQAYQETELFSPHMPCMAGDEYFNLKVFPYLHSMYKTDKVVYCYRLGGTVDHYNRFFPEVFFLSDMRLRILDNSNYDKAYKPLFIEYINCFYTHAEQLIKLAKEDKDKVIAFFNEELDKRNVFLSRMEDFFEEHNVQKVGAKFMFDRDFDGMYSHALTGVKRHNTLKSRLRRLGIKLIELLG